MTSTSERPTHLEWELSRWPLCAEHVAKIACYSSTKKAAAACSRLFHRGIVKRLGLFLPGRNGRPVTVYYRGAAPLPRTHFHVYETAAAHVQVQDFGLARQVGSYFLYPKECPTTGGLLPDAAWLFGRGGRSLLSFLEIDSGSESLTVLGDKLSRYASYFDGGAYARDFKSLGTFEGFRVFLIVTNGRLRNVMELARREGHDFLFVSTFDRCRKHGMGGLVWESILGPDRVDLLGNRGEELGGKGGGEPGPAGPRPEAANPLCLQEDAGVVIGPNTQELGEETGAA